MARNLAKIPVDSVEFSVVSIDGRKTTANEKSKLISNAKKQVRKRGAEILSAVDEQLKENRYIGVLPSNKELAELACPYSCVICPDDQDWFGSLYFAITGLDEGVGVRVDFGITYDLLNADMHFSG